jgi:C1A family cysteine protease
LARKKAASAGFVHKDFPASRYAGSRTPDKQFRQIAIPNAMDLRPKLTRIENQGLACNSCWAFALTSLNRDGHVLDGTDPGRLSQEWLVEYSTRSWGCSGGSFDSAADLISPLGQPLWSDCPYKSGVFPYQPGAQRCAADLPLAAGIKNWGMLGTKELGPSPLDIETYMTMHGKPVAIAIASMAGTWQNYSGGVYSDCVFDAVDHMMTLVGWDNEGADFDKTGYLPPGKGYWILRNSRGDRWGENGYMRIKMTGPDGRRCNNAAAEAAYFVFR